MAREELFVTPLVARTDVRVWHTASGIVTESWSPLGGNGDEVLAEPVVARIAAETGRTPAQVVLRWHVQLGLVAVPRSANPERLRQNLDVVGFELTPAQLDALSALDRGESAAVDSDDFGH